MLQSILNLFSSKKQSYTTLKPSIRENPEVVETEIRTLKVELKQPMSRVDFEKLYLGQSDITPGEVKIAEQESKYLLPNGTVDKIQLLSRSHNKTDGYVALFECSVSGLRKKGTGVRCVLEGSNVNKDNRKLVQEAVHQLMLYSQLDYTEIQIVEINKQNHKNEIIFEYWLNHNIMKKFHHQKGIIINTFETNTTLSNALKNQYIDYEHYYVLGCKQTHNHETKTTNVFEVEYWPSNQVKQSENGVVCVITNNSLREYSARELIDYHIKKRGGVDVKFIKLIEFRPGYAKFEYWTDNSSLYSQNGFFSKTVHLPSESNLASQLKNEGYGNCDYIITSITPPWSQSKQWQYTYSVELLPKHSEKYEFGPNNITGIICKITDQSNSNVEPTNEQLVNRFCRTTGISPELIYVKERINQYQTITLTILYWKDVNSKEIYEKKNNSLVEFTTKTTSRDVKGELYEEYIDYVDFYLNELRIFKDGTHQFKLQYIPLEV